jgi:hypothetical protein
MEPEGSLPCSQKSATCPYPQPNKSSPHPPPPYPPILITIFHHWHLTKGYVQLWGFFEQFVIRLAFTVRGELAPRPTPMLEGSPLSTIRASLFNTVAATLHFWSPSPQRAPRGQAMPLCPQSTYHKITNLQLLQMCRISWLVVEPKDSVVLSNLCVLNTSNGNTVQKRYYINAWNVFIIIWNVLTHKCCHYWFFRLQLTLHSPQLVAEHAGKWYANISYSTLWHLDSHSDADDDPTPSSRMLRLVDR